MKDVDKQKPSRTNEGVKESENESLRQQALIDMHYNMKPFKVNKVEPSLPTFKTELENIKRNQSRIENKIDQILKKLKA